MFDLYSKSVEGSLQALETDAVKGLSKENATKRILQYGENRLESKKERSIFLKFLDQFKDFLVIILIIAAGISIFLGETLDGSIIGLIVVVNAFLGVMQENKASNALKALKELASPNSKVVRDGKTVSIPSSEVCRAI